jgi:hypothetical protein
MVRTEKLAGRKKEEKKKKGDADHFLEMIRVPFYPTWASVNCRLRWAKSTAVCSSSVGVCGTLGVLGIEPAAVTSFLAGASGLRPATWFPSS